MIDWKNTSWTTELVERWGWATDGRCYCGCAKPPVGRGFFASGHDLRVVYPLLTSLLVMLRGNPEAEEIVRAVADHHLQ